MGFFSCCCSFISAAAEAISSMATSIASKIGETILGVLKIVSAIVETVATVLGVIRSDERIEELGEKTLQAAEAGITMESCGNDFSKYQHEIRSFQIDPEKAQNRRLEDKLIAGICFVDQGISQKYPFLNMASAYPLFAMKSDFFTAARVASYAQTAVELQYNFSKIKSFFDGSCSMGDKKKTEEFIYAAESKFNPDFKLADLKKDIADTKFTVRRG